MLNLYEIETAETAKGSEASRAGYHLHAEK
jgi:hypothetical protein